MIDLTDCIEYIITFRHFFGRKVSRSFRYGWFLHTYYYFMMFIDAQKYDFIRRSEDSLYLIIRFDTVHISDPTNIAMGKFRSMTYFKGYFLGIVEFAPDIFSDKIKAVHIDHFTILRFRIVAIGYINNIAANIFLDNKPRTTT